MYPNHARTRRYKVIMPEIFVESSKVEEVVVFYKNAFGAKEGRSSRDYQCEGNILLDVSVDMNIGSLSFNVYNRTSVKEMMSKRMVLWLETEDIEAAFEKAVKAGVVVAEVELTEGEGSSEASRLVKERYGIIRGFCTPTAKETDDVEA